MCWGEFSISQICHLRNSTFVALHTSEANYECFLHFSHNFYAKINLLTYFYTYYIDDNVTWWCLFNLSLFSPHVLHPLLLKVISQLNQMSTLFSSFHAHSLYGSNVMWLYQHITEYWLFIYVIANQLVIFTSFYLALMKCVLHWCKAQFSTINIGNRQYKA